MLIEPKFTIWARGDYIDDIPGEAIARLVQHGKSRGMTEISVIPMPDWF